MIDLVCSELHYMAHLAPVWDALPHRGQRAYHRRTADAALVASAYDLGKATRLGYKRIAYLEHGIGQSYGNGNRGYPGGKGREAVSLFLSPNATAGAADQRANPHARVVLVGDPRLDTLPAREPGPLTVAISFHWDALDWKPFRMSALSHYRKVLGDLARAFPLIGHAHPRAAHTLEYLYRRLGIEFVPDFDEVCRRADLYIADNTSTLYEFAATGRPVVVLNAPWYRRDVELGLRFWSASNVGINVDEPGELIPAVERALTDPPSAEAALDIAYAYRTGAGPRAAAAIADWLAQPVQAAA